jgi:acyl carrier protein
VLGGEVARRSDLDLFRLRFRRPARFVNGLGLTECTAGLQYFADHDTRVLGQSLPVGLPVAGVTAEALDAAGAPGAWQGELALATTYLAQGYHGNAGLTAARFLADGAAGTADRPLATAGRRLRTGDRVRRLPDGQWLHAGRLDAQLKVRGIRVEPAEIEAVLRAVEGIADCCVGPWEPEPGDLRLAAWCVAPAGLDAAAVRAALRARLPGHLVPERFVAVAGLPRLANGKVDRAGLPAPGPGDATAGVPVPPRTEIERRLAQLWCGVLGRESIGVHDDFFALGGHSLLATRLIARVRDAFGLEVPLLALFEGPTVAGMAAAVERTARRPAEPGLPALRRRPRRAGGSAAS